MARSSYASVLLCGRDIAVLSVPTQTLVSSLAPAEIISKQLLPDTSLYSATPHAQFKIERPEKQLE